MKVFCIFAVVVSLGLITQSERTFGATLTPLWQFTNGVDGSFPVAGLVQGSDGNFYGQASGGGSNGWGTVFRVTTAGSLTPLYSFTFSPDGAVPQAELVRGNDGNLYGTASEGGTGDNGTIFHIGQSGGFTNVYRFGDGADGSDPEAPLVLGNDGNFYGTTAGGGTNGGNGAAFRITSAGTLTPLHSFTGGADGSSPSAGLVQGSDGNFYGTAVGGGSNYYGTVFMISTGGTFKTLWQFSGGADGGAPFGGLVQGSDSNFYGTAADGGTNGLGVVFRMSSAGTLTTLWQFSGPDGAVPEAGLVLGTNGNFYGTTTSGGTNDNGTLFEITTTGAFTNLYLFTGSADGSNPQAPLVLGSDGNFYGTAYAGGASNAGTVFKLNLASGATPQISSIQIIGTNVVVTMPSTSGDTYQLQVTASMAPTNWANVVGASQSGTGNPIMLTNFGGALQTQRFYRVGVTF